MKKLLLLASLSLPMLATTEAPKDTLAPRTIDCTISHPRPTSDKVAQVGMKILSDAAWYSAVFAIVGYFASPEPMIAWIKTGALTGTFCGAFDAYSDYRKLSQEHQEIQVKLSIPDTKPVTAQK
jgi:hypothetical protein